MADSVGEKMTQADDQAVLDPKCRNNNTQYARECNIFEFW